MLNHTRNLDNKRIFPNIKFINLISILFWYLDDGSLSIIEQKREGRKNSIHRKLRIHLQSYDDEDIIKFIRAFNNKFDLSFKPFYENIKGNRKIVAIGVSNNIKEIAKFLDLIFPYINLIPKSMHYKFCLCYLPTLMMHDKVLEKYNICDFHKTKICQCRNKDLSHI